mgnify:FL=1
MHNTILITFMMVLTAVPASAQFYTITKDTALTVEKSAVTREVTDSTVPSIQEIAKKSGDCKEARNDENHGYNSLNTRKSDDRKSQETVGKSEYRTAREKYGELPERLTDVAVREKLPELTIPNLLAEIKKNGIKYPKIVLAQAILETGWFKSSVCRNKHNLFGLTNPRTKNYYEFNHWTESVKAYMDKVQYRYSGGNYLLWLKKIGYAEDKGYIRAIIKLLRQL